MTHPTDSMVLLTIQRKVFLATLALATAMAVLLVEVTRWNLGQGFERYATAAELTRVDWLATNIESGYAAHGNWDFVRSAPEQEWRAFFRRPGDGGGRNGPEPRQDLSLGPPPGEAQAPRWPAGGRIAQGPVGRAPGESASDWPSGLPTPRPPPDGDILGIAPRLTLLDADGGRLAGNSAGQAPGAERAIRYQGATVGHLALQAAPTATRELEAAFMAGQTQNMLLAALAALLLSLIVSWALSRHLLAPIRSLADATRRIAAGGLDARIAINRGDELGELGSNFNEMARRLAQTEESRRAWISDTSHELRTPLAVLRAEIEAIQDGVRAPDTGELARMHKQVQQLAALVDDLRLTLDGPPGGGEIENLPLQPIALIRESIAAFRDRYQSAHIAIDTAGLPDSAWRVRGDAGRLTQVFSNLLENTLRYTHRGGQLRVAALARDRRLVLQFDDSAPAPRRDALPHLFERFFRAEPSRSRAFGGSGLGLAICKTLIELHGGRISAGLSKLGGLAIRIELPLEGE